MSIVPGFVQASQNGVQFIISASNYESSGNVHRSVIQHTPSNGDDRSRAWCRRSSRVVAPLAMSIMRFSEDTEDTMEWFETLGRQLLKAQPEPPWRVPRVPMLKLWTQGVFIGVIVLLVGVILSMPYMIETYGWTNVRSLRTYMGIASIMILSSVLIIGPIIRYLILRHGVLRVVRVTKVRSRSKERLAPAFIGLCTHPLNPALTQELRFERPWAATLRVGSEIDVLVYPPQRAWFVFGLGPTQSPTVHGRR